MSDRSWLVLTDGYLTERNAKTAHGVIRYSRDRITAVVDAEHAGKTVAEVMPELGRDAPIVASVTEGLSLQPSSLLLGVATPGGWIPEHWRPWIVEAIEAGLEIANGLHRFLSDDPELVALARARGAKLWDIRKPPRDIPLNTGRVLKLDKSVVLTVGSDCAVGKKTAAIELARAGAAAGVATEFVATGQTGVLIAGKGIAVDRVVADFLAGAAEKLVCETDASTGVAVVEGQGSLWHPAYSGVTLGLLHGSAPHVMVLCHEAGRTAIEEPPYTALPPLAEMVETYQGLASAVRPATVACVALNCGGMGQLEADAAIAEIEEATGLPTADVLRGGAPKLWDAVATALPPNPRS